MKCEYCVEQGLTSRVTSHGGTRTLLGGGGAYWDEEGVSHYHDPNISTWHYSCSNRHRWWVKEKPACPSCDYGKDAYKVGRLEDLPEHPPGMMVLTGPETLSNKKIQEGS